MNENPTCIADDEGRACHRDAVVLRPVALCHPHRIEIALTVVPDLLRDGLAAALTSNATPVAVRDDLVATATATPVGDLLHGVHDSVVYFIANGGRVKIGYTTNLKNRLSALALRSDSVLLTLQGGPELERALHTRFTAYRNGNTEWFELSPELFRYASTRNAAEPVLQHDHGDGETRPLSEIAKKASGPADLVKALAAHGIPKDALVSEAIRLRPDMVADSIRRTAKRLGEGPYL
jgi:hypothetical protein